MKNVNIRNERKAFRKLKRTHHFQNLVKYKVTQAVVGEWYCSIPLFVPSVGQLISQHTLKKMICWL